MYWLHKFHPLSLVMTMEFDLRGELTTFRYEKARFLKMVFARGTQLNAIILHTVQPAVLLYPQTLNFCFYTCMLGPK